MQVKLKNFQNRIIGGETRTRPSEEYNPPEMQFRKLSENTLHGLAVLQDSRFVYCNRVFAEMTGFTAGELLSFSPDEISQMIHTDDRESIGNLNLSLAEGKPLPPRCEYRMTKKTGTAIWLEMYPGVTEYNGRPAMQSSIFEITERKQSDGNLRKALDWQKAIFEGSRDAVFISDIHSQIVDANKAACELTGYTKEELMMMKAADLQEEADLKILEKIHGRILAGEDIRGEAAVFTKNGQNVDVEFSHRRVVIVGVPYVHTVARDITERERLESQLIQSQKMEAIGSLAGGVAHDFNNLVSVIKGYTELLLEELDPDSPLRPDLKQIEKAAQKASSLTSQLLSFSRKKILHTKIIDLNASVKELIPMLQRLIGEDIELDTYTCPDLGRTTADPGQIQQIIMNLTANARDAMPDGGKLTIETANIDFDTECVRQNPAMREGPYVMLAISDTGIGMDRETRAHAFEPFFTTKDKGQGTGLGLSTVYGIVKQSNGFIWVYSEPGNGATFKIYLPRAKDKADASGIKSKPEHASHGKETVLIVEDEASVRSLAARILRDRGYKVLEACDGNEALRVAEKQTEAIHLMLADVIMPGMNGSEVASRLKASRPDIKTLYMSGYTDSSIVNQGILKANVSFLQKPFTMESLARKVREAIER